MSTNSNGKTWAIVGIIVLVLFILSRIFSEKSTHPIQSKENTTSSVTEQSIQDLKDLGFIKRITPELNEVFVDNLIWLNMDYEAKKNVGRLLAIYCSQFKHSTAVWVDIRDYMSGKKLAKYSEAFGFSVE